MCFLFTDVTQGLGLQDYRTADYRIGQARWARNICFSHCRSDKYLAEGIALNAAGR